MGAACSRGDSSSDPEHLPSLVNDGVVDIKDISKLGEALEPFRSDNGQPSTEIHNRVIQHLKIFPWDKCAASVLLSSDKDEEDEENDTMEGNTSGGDDAANTGAALDLVVDVMSLMLNISTSSALAKSKTLAGYFDASYPSLFLTKSEEAPPPATTTTKKNDSEKKQTSSPHFLTLKDRASLFKMNLSVMKKAIMMVIACTEFILSDIVLNLFREMSKSKADMLTTWKLTSRKFFGSKGKWKALKELAVKHSLKTASDVLEVAVRNALKLLFLFIGGEQELRGDEVVRTVEAEGRCDSKWLERELEIRPLSRVFHILAAKFPSSGGIHKNDVVKSEAAVFGAVLASLGVLHPRNDTDTVQGIVAEIPSFCVSLDVVSTLGFFFFISKGQRRMSMCPVHRSSVFETTMKLFHRSSHGISLEKSGTMNATALPPSLRFFPTFAKEGVGIERGEGHGPRKELFDMCAADAMAGLSSPVDITAYVVLSSPSKEASGARISIRWLALQLLEFEKGDIITFSMKGQHADSEGKSEGKQRAGLQIRRATVNQDRRSEWQIDFSGRPPPEVVAAITQKNGAGVTVVVQKHQIPCFKLDDGQQFCWLNDALPDCDVKFPFKKGLCKQEEWLEKFYVIGFLLGSSVANGVAFPVSFPPLLFKILRDFHPREKFHHKSPKRSGKNRELLYQPNEMDISLFDYSMYELLDMLRKMKESELRALLDGEDSDLILTLSSNTVEATVEKYIAQSIIGRIVQDEKRAYLVALAFGFHDVAGDLIQSPLFMRVNSRQLRSVFCGAADDGVSSFSFADQFYIIFPKELSSYPHGEVFKDIIVAALEEEENGEDKRQVLKFITGRTLLPARPKAEYIKVEFPFSLMCSRDCDTSYRRLPVAHSCDNVLELPHYLECLLFGSKSPWYDKNGSSKVGKLISDMSRETAWIKLTDEEKNSMIADAYVTFQTKLRQAVVGSSTYELDDANTNKNEHASYMESFPVVGEVTTPPSSHSLTRKESCSITSPLNRKESFLGETNQLGRKESFPFHRENWHQPRAADTLAKVQDTGNSKEGLDEVEELNTSNEKRGLGGSGQLTRSPSPTGGESSSQSSPTFIRRKKSSSHSPVSKRKQSELEDYR